MKLLNCIICYNRFEELKNLINSMKRYSNLNNTLIVDDGSSNYNINNLLKELEKEGVNLILNKRWDHKKYHTFIHNGLYENMDLGVQFAIANGYDYINFLHEDVQFIRDTVEFFNHIDDYFNKKKDMSQISIILPTKKYLIKRAIRPEINNSDDIWWLRPHGMLNMGIVPIRLLKKYKFRYGNGDENTNSGWWRRRGYNVYSLQYPLLAIIPNRSKYIEGRKVKEFNGLKKELQLTPFAQTKIKKNTFIKEDFPIFENYYYNKQ